MRFNVKVIPNAKEEKVEIEKENMPRVYTREPPIGGKANRAVINLLANFFKVEKSRVRLISGEKSRRKVIEIIDEGTV